MAEISGKMYIVVGAAVIFLSYLVNTMRNTKAFSVFMVVGGLFVGVGIVKIWARLNRHTELHDEHLTKGHLHSVDKAVPPHLRPATEPKISHYCSRCGFPMRMHDIFCAHCGFRAG